MKGGSATDCQRRNDVKTEDDRTLSAVNDDVDDGTIMTG
jgi:hypothetical protein